ncbi:hypothetical protein ACP275_05G015000 [Erythranthe tilingii]
MGSENMKMVRGRRRRIKRKIKKLQKIIPGGQGLNPDSLFVRTADYILLLRLQIHFLQTTLSHSHIP